MKYFCFIFFWSKNIDLRYHFLPKKFGVYDDTAIGITMFRYEVEMCFGFNKDLFVGMKLRQGLFFVHLFRSSLLFNGYLEHHGGVLMFTMMSTIATLSRAFVQIKIPLNRQFFSCGL